MEKLVIPEAVNELVANNSGIYNSKSNTNPKEIKFCKRCVISNQRPRITFNKDGVCSACDYAERKHTKIDWKEREEILIDLLNKYRSKDGRHDCIVPVSGGKDSGAVAHQLKYKYNMNPLTVTFAPLRWTDIGWLNLRSLIDAGFDNILNIPSTKAYRLLVRLSTEYLGDPFQPFVYGVHAFPMQMAIKYNIPLIFYGENGEVEYGGDIRNADEYVVNSADDLRDHFFKGMMPEEWEKYGIKKEYIKPFLLPPVDQVEEMGVKHSYFSFFKKWIPQENYYYSAEHTGFKPNPEGRSEGTYSKYASLDDRFDGFHYYFAFLKFGVGRATSDAAHEIRDRHISREEGVNLVRKYDGEFPDLHFKEFLDYIDINEEYFWQIVDKFRTPCVWERHNQEWKLRCQVEQEETVRV